MAISVDQDQTIRSERSAEVGVGYEWGWIICLFVLRFYGPVNPLGHVERGQFT